jgi:hypothetical protein
MADNIAVTPGSGATIAADDVGGVLYQHVKPAFGTSGNATMVSATDPMPVGGSGAAALGKAEDAAHTTGDVGVPAMGVVTTDNDGTTVTDGDYAMQTINALGALRVQDTPNTTGGLSSFKSIDLDESEEEVKGAAGMLYSLNIYNNHATDKRYVKLYDNTAAGTTVGTTTPKNTFVVPAGQNLSLAWDKGIACATGITLAATTGVADNDTGAPAANDVIVNATFK